MAGDTLHIPPGLVRWLSDQYPEYPHAYWGQSGACLLYEALRQEDRSTVILPAFMCPTMSAMATAAGKRLIHVDVDPRTLHMDVGQLGQCLAAGRDADTVVLMDHAFGYPFPAIARLRQEHPDLLVIEDCARALGSSMNGRPVGRHGDWLLISMYKTIHGNDHGALLLTRKPYRMATGPAPRPTLRQRTCTWKPVRVAYEAMKRRRPDFEDTPHDRQSPNWRPSVASPNDLCLRRFDSAVAGLGLEVKGRRKAAAELKEALCDVPGIRFVEEAHGCESASYFLTFTVAGDSRNRLLTHLHRRGLFLLRTWDMVPPFFRCFSDTFPYGASGSRFLADHVAQIPVHRFVSARERDRLRRCVLEFISTDGPRAGRLVQDLAGNARA